jgi:hypothetical protein
MWMLPVPSRSRRDRRWGRTRRPIAGSGRGS